MPSQAMKKPQSLATLNSQHWQARARDKPYLRDLRHSKRHSHGCSTSKRTTLGNSSSWKKSKRSLCAITANTRSRSLTSVMIRVTLIRAKAKVLVRKRMTRWMRSSRLQEKSSLCGWASARIFNHKDTRFRQAKRSNRLLLGTGLVSRSDSIRSSQIS